MQTHRVSVLPFQKPRQRDPVPDLPRLHPRYPHWGGTLPAPAEGPQPPDDWGVPGQQQEAVQQGCAGVSVENFFPPPCTVKELPDHSAPGCNSKYLILHALPSSLFRNFNISIPYLASLNAYPSNVFLLWNQQLFHFSLPSDDLRSSSRKSAPSGGRTSDAKRFCDWEALWLGSHPILIKHLWCFLGSTKRGRGGKISAPCCEISRVKQTLAPHLVLSVRFWEEWPFKFFQLHYGNSKREIGLICDNEEACMRKHATKGLSLPLQSQSNEEHPHSKNSNDLSCPSSEQDLRFPPYFCSVAAGLFPSILSLWPFPGHRSCASLSLHLSPLSSLAIWAAKSCEYLRPQHLTIALPSPW